MAGGLLAHRASLEDYVAAGGGVGLERARTLGPQAVVDLLTDSGLRGRGGAGFPTGTKWRSVRTGTGARFVVCNAAEGEPATFKDRQLLRHNPYQVIEGIAIAAHTIGAKNAYIGLKQTFAIEIECVSSALDEMRSAGMLDGFDVELVAGPDRYLLGEETGLLGVIENRGPFPREIRPFMHGLYASSATDNPTLVNNVETLANVPWIVAFGADWLRQTGTHDAPGTMCFTVAGDVAHEGVYELSLGTRLHELIDVHAGGTPNAPVKAVLPGASNAVITETSLDLPLDFDVLRRNGTGLGAGGFAVYDSSACMVEVTRAFAHFLHVESCAQCPPCKLASGGIFDLVQAFHDGRGTTGDLDAMINLADKVTDGQKCALPSGTRVVVLSLIQAFAHEFAEHAGSSCPSRRGIVLPKLIDHDEETGRFLYDRAYADENPQWAGPLTATRHAV